MDKWNSVETIVATVYTAISNRKEMFSRNVVRFVVVLSSLSLCCSRRRIIRTSNSHNILRYSVTEESPAGLFIADLRSDVEIKSTRSSSTDRLFTFTSLANASFFSLNELTGVLRTSVSIDRETICPRQDQCLLFADFVLQPDNKHYCKVKH